MPFGGARAAAALAATLMLSAPLARPSLAQPASGPSDERVRQLEQASGLRLAEKRRIAERAAPKEVRDSLDRARRSMLANPGQFIGGKPTFTLGWSPMTSEQITTVAGTRIPDEYHRTFDRDRELSEAMLKREQRMLTSLDDKGYRGPTMPGRGDAAAGSVKGNAAANRPPLCDPSAASFNWRDAGKVSPVVDQRSCGSCWAFALAAALESSHLIRNGYPNKVSEQHLLSCSRAGSCNGGWYFDALRRLSGTGAGEGTAYPYTATSSVCDTRKATPHHWSAWGRVSRSCNTASAGDRCPRATVEEIKDALCRHGPVMSSLFVDDFFLNYNPRGDGGPAEGEAEEVLNVALQHERTNHAVLIVGWDNAKSAWLIKNSWGTERWGYGGFGWVHYDGNNVGYGATWVEARKDVHIPDRCVRFSPTSARVISRLLGGERYWFIADGDQDIEVFGATPSSENDARTALTLMRHHGIDRRCNAARSSDHVAFHFWLAGSGPPVGNFAGEDCIDIEWQRLDVNKVVSDQRNDATQTLDPNGKQRIAYDWVITDGRVQLEAFTDEFEDSEAEAWVAYAYLKKHRITKMCYLSRTENVERLRYYRR